MIRVDVVRDHVEQRPMPDRDHEVATLIFPNGTTAKWSQNEVEFAASMCRGWARAMEAAR
jgi:hypothetical protein